jgi:hypothetical protein
VAGNKDLKVVLFNAKGQVLLRGVDVGEHMGDMAPKMIEFFTGSFASWTRSGR